MLGFYNYTVILTYIGLLVGFGGILSAMGGNTLGAILCLMGSGLCDMFDGKIAATMERTPSEKQFGIQIDSLSDLLFALVCCLLSSSIRATSILRGCAEDMFCAPSSGWHGSMWTSRHGRSTPRNGAGNIGVCR